MFFICKDANILAIENIIPLYMKKYTKDVYPKMYIYNSRNNQIIYPVLFCLPLTNLKVQSPIPWQILFGVKYMNRFSC